MKLIFVRNGPVIMDYTSKLNAKKVAESLSDFNLIVWKNILIDKDEEREASFCYTILLFDELSVDQYLNILDKMNSPRQNKQEEKFVGRKISNLIFVEYYPFNHEIFVCENFTGLEDCRINKRKVVIDLNVDKFFTDEEKDFIVKTVNEKFNEDINTKGSYVNRHPFSYEGVFTPIVIRIASKEYTIGLVYSSGGLHETMSVMLCLSRNIFTNRSVIIKLLSYFVHIFTSRYPTVNCLSNDDKDNVLLNFTTRNCCMTFYEDTFITPTKEYFDKKFNKLTFGCDVEFLYLGEYFDNESVKLKFEPISAYEVVKKYHESIGEKDVDLQKTKIGTDGDSRIGEIRTNVYQMEEGAYEKLAREVESLLIEALIHGNKSNYHITLCSEEFPLGYHIHLGFQKFKEFDSVEANIIARNFIYLLDVILTSFLVTLNSRGRFHGSYFRYCNYEIKTYGFEYRSLPASIVYYEIHRQVLELFQKVAEDYYKNGFVVVEMENEDKISRRFYTKYLGRQTRTWFSNIRKLRNSIAKYHSMVNEIPDEFIFAPEEYEIKLDALVNTSDYFADELLRLIIDLNKHYVKDNCVVYFYGLHRNRGDYTTTIKNTKYCIEEVHPSLFYRENHPALNRFNIYSVGLARNLREIDKDEDIKNKRHYLSEVIYQLLKQLEANSDLKYSAEKVYAKLCKKYKFLDKIYVSSKV